jgi:two-component system cell cycle sensor histidine kinase/response regulator CckA
MSSVNSLAKTTAFAALPGGRTASNEFRFSEAQLRSLYDCTPVGILLTEPAGGILAANPAACSMLGRTEEQLRRLTRLDLVKAGDPRLPALLAERERTGRYQGELTMVRGDGSTLEADVTSVLATNEDESVVSMVIRDVTERKRLEARVKEQAQWLDRASEAIFATDLDHRITYWNQGAERMTGWTAAEMLGRGVTDLLKGTGISDPRTATIREQLADWRGTMMFRHRDGTPRVAAVSVTVLRDVHGEPSQRLTLCADVTEQQHLQEKYERALRLQSIGMLASGVAHDFNNILTPISLSVQMLREQLTHRDGLELLETIRACVSRGAAVSRQILDFAQGVGNEARAIQVGPILREVADIVRETFPRSITLGTDVAAGLWSVMASPTQIHQLLLNLSINARDAMPQGGHLRLGAHNRILDEANASRIEGARKGAWLVLSVEDTGTGIAPEYLRRIWEPFFTTKPHEQGTGLGLSTVREIVETHAGFIAVDTMAGRGTAFRVYLPALGSEIPPPAQAGPHEATIGGGENILVAEDERGVRKVVETALTRAGYRVATAANGAEALDMIRAQPGQFDLIITDIDMPVLNGAKLALALAEIRPELPVMAMSGLSTKSAEVDPARFSGGFLPKPFAMDELLLAVGAALVRKEQAA